MVSWRRCKPQYLRSIRMSTITFVWFGKSKNEDGKERKKSKCGGIFTAAESRWQVWRCSAYCSFDFSILHIVCYTTKSEETEEPVSIFLEESETGWCNSLMKVPWTCPFFSPIATGGVQASPPQWHSGESQPPPHWAPSPHLSPLPQAARMGPRITAPTDLHTWPRAARSTSFIPLCSPPLHPSPGWCSGHVDPCPAPWVHPPCSHLFCLVGPSVLPTFLLGHGTTSSPPNTTYSSVTISRTGPFPDSGLLSCCSIPCPLLPPPLTMYTRISSLGLQYAIPTRHGCGKDAIFEGIRTKCCTARWASVTIPSTVLEHKHFCRHFTDVKTQIEKGKRCGVILE